MTIKEVCKRTGVSQDTIRYYEKAGVIPGIDRSCGGTRCYSEDDLKWIETAMCLRSAGVSVAGIAEYVQLTMQGDATFEKRLALLRAEQKKVAAQKECLETALALLDYKIHRYEEAVETGRLVWDEEACEQYLKEKAGRQ